jgi:hypothetical protein
VGDYAKAVRRGVQVALVLMIGLVVLNACGSADGKATGSGDPTNRAERTLSVREVKTLLRQLPYRYRFRRVKAPEGATGAVAGRVYGRHGAWFDFGIALGPDAHPVPMPNSGTESATSNGSANFVFTDDTLVKGKNGNWSIAPNIKNERQWQQVINIGNRMEQRLCRAATGMACPV